MKSVEWIAFSNFFKFLLFWRVGSFFSYEVNTLSLLLSSFKRLQFVVCAVLCRQSSNIKGRDSVVFSSLPSHLQKTERDTFFIILSSFVLSLIITTTTNTHTYINNERRDRQRQRQTERKRERERMMRRGVLLLLPPPQKWCRAKNQIFIVA